MKRSIALDARVHLPASSNSSRPAGRWCCARWTRARAAGARLQCTGDPCPRATSCTVPCHRPGAGASIDRSNRAASCHSGGATQQSRHRHSAAAGMTVPSVSISSVVVADVSARGYEPRWQSRLRDRTPRRTARCSTRRTQRSRLGTPALGHRYWQRAPSHRRARCA